MDNNLQTLKKRSGDFGATLASFVIRYRWFTLFISILLVLIAGLGAGKMTFNGDYHVFFSEDNPQLKAFDALQNKYTKDDNVFILFEPDDKNVFTARTLTAIENITTKSVDIVPVKVRVKKKMTMAIIRNISGVSVDKSLAEDSLNALVSIIVPDV